MTLELGGPNTSYYERNVSLNLPPKMGTAGSVPHPLYNQSISLHKLYIIIIIVFIQK